MNSIDYTQNIGLLFSQQVSHFYPIKNISFLKRFSSWKFECYKCYYKEFVEQSSRAKLQSRMFINLYKVYMSLVMFNSMQFYHVSQEDLAYGLDISSVTLNKYLSILDKLNLIRIQHYSYYGKSSNNYYVNQVSTNSPSELSSIIEFRFKISSHLNRNLHVHIYNTFEDQVNNGIMLLNKTSLTKLSSSYPYSINLLSSICSNTISYAQISHLPGSSSYLEFFKHNYTELVYKNTQFNWEIPLSGFEVREGNDSRLYHPFHSFSKETRNENIFWEGQHIQEAWDLHSAIFVYLWYDLDKKHIIPTEELNRFYDLVVRDRNLYETVQEFVRKNHSLNVELPREVIKTNLQIYLHNNKVPNDPCFKLIDLFFDKNFHNIRKYIINYSTRREYTGKEYTRRSKNGKLSVIKQTKLVKNLYRDLIPFERMLITEGVCKTLLEEYNIKTVTVHDAIYMKTNDIEYLNKNNISIQKLFDTLLTTNKFI